MELKLIELSKKDRQFVYDEHVVKDFHESEVKPFEMIEKLVNKDQYKCYGFYNNSDFLGYAYLVKPVKADNLLIDYLAVCNGSRSNGLGTEFVRVLREKFNGKYSSLLAEVEDPEHSSSEEDKVNRMRRISFYQRNGFEVSDVTTHVLVDDYRIIKLNLNQELKDSEIVVEMNGIYKTIFGSEFFKKHVSVSI